MHLNLKRKNDNRYREYKLKFPNLMPRITDSRKIMLYTVRQCYYPEVLSSTVHRICAGPVILRRHYVYLKRFHRNTNVRQAYYINKSKIIRTFAITHF
jgi:hypothetical protein